MDETETAVTALGRRFLAIKADLAGIDVIEPAVAEASAQAGPIDILVNNAGIIRRADALDFTEADWDDVMNVNLKSVFFL
ncbi:SDR family NAD(P)-dependent oxidoreductase, partial [Acinetobacter baumannii]